MVLTEQPIQSEPHRATPVLSTRRGVAEAPLGGVSPTFPFDLASTIVAGLANSPSSMLSLSIFHGRWEDIITRLETQTFVERELELECGWLDQTDWLMISVRLSDGQLICFLD